MIYIFGAIVYCFLSSGEKQSWAEVEYSSLLDETDEDGQEEVIMERQLLCVIRDLKQLRRQRQRKNKTNWFYEQSNSSARLLVDFFDVHSTTAT